MIYEKEIDIYLEAKQQSKVNKATTVISIRHSAPIPNFTMN
jgi:hypothetical protein